MKWLPILFMGLLSVTCCGADERESNRLYSLVPTGIDGKAYPLSRHRGQVILIVNTASKCGFTDQYRDLQDLFEKYKARGLVVLGFPSNDFANQEPGSNTEIKEFCKLKYGVTFPLLARGHVTGPEKQPVYKYLTEEAGQEFHGEVGWNFEKFLIDRGGALRNRWGSFTRPLNSDVETAIKGLLDEPVPGRK